MKNYADLGGCYPPGPSALVNNIPFDLHNSSHPTQPHSIIILLNVTSDKTGVTTLVSESISVLNYDSNNDYIHWNNRMQWEKKIADKKQANHPVGHGN